jgi:hypothetical protein
MKQFLYVHIPKTAGTSVSSSGILSGFGSRGHSLARQINDIDEYFSFCFIRNPYSRFLSGYNYYRYVYRRTSRGRHNAKEARQVRNPADQAGSLIEGCSNFKEYCVKYAEKIDSHDLPPVSDKIIKSEQSIKNINGKQFAIAYGRIVDQVRLQMVSQYDYITSDAGVVLVDFIGKFENINEDFKSLQEKNKTNNLKTLPFKNNTRGSGLHESLDEPWEASYDQESADIVYDIFKKDFEYFGYSKNSYCV